MLGARTQTKQTLAPGPAQLGGSQNLRQQPPQSRAHSQAGTKEQLAPGCCKSLWNEQLQRKMPPEDGGWGQINPSPRRCWHCQHRDGSKYRGPVSCRAGAENPFKFKQPFLAAKNETPARPSREIPHPRFWHFLLEKKELAVMPRLRPRHTSVATPVYTTMILARALGHDADS